MLPILWSIIVGQRRQGVARAEDCALAGELIRSAWRWCTRRSALRRGWPARGWPRRCRSPGCLVLFAGGAGLAVAVDVRGLRAATAVRPDREVVRRFATLARRPCRQRVRDGRGVGADRESVRRRAAGRCPGLPQRDARRLAGRHGAVLARGRHERAAAAGGRFGGCAVAACGRLDGRGQACLRGPAPGRRVWTVQPVLPAARCSRSGARSPSARRPSCWRRGATGVCDGVDWQPVAPRRWAGCARRGLRHPATGRCARRARGIRCNRSSAPRSGGAERVSGCRLQGGAQRRRVRRRPAQRRPAGDAGFLCRLVRLVQGDGALHVRRALPCARR